MVERSIKKPELFTSYAAGLFAAMADGGEFALEDVPRFNGGLFTGEEAPRLEPKELRVLLEAARLDWGSVESAIFRTLFERSMDPTQRARLGAHYTSREDILTIVEPVLMAPLRREWGSVQEEVEDLAGTMEGQGQHDEEDGGEALLFRAKDPGYEGTRPGLRLRELSVRLFKTVVES